MSGQLLLAASGATSVGASVTFWLLAIVSVLGALGMVLSRNAVHSALWLVLTMLCLGFLYVVNAAPFLGAVQIIVYTGAVLMLFLFVLMIVGVSAADSLRETIPGQRLAAGLAGIGFLVLLSLTVGHAALGPAAPAKATYGAANVTRIATLIFTRYFYPFEVTSALLITAALGAMVLAHRERTSPKLTQRDLSRLRVAGGHPAPLPGPGTYARHNAVDFPALLPDGTPAALSVSPVIAQRPGAREAVGEALREAAGALPASPAGGEAARREANGAGQEGQSS
jgi:NADH-quinone oxidoreductase subunit J